MGKELFLSKYHFYQTFLKKTHQLQLTVPLHLSNNITNNDLITRID